MYVRKERNKMNGKDLLKAIDILSKENSNSVLRKKQQKEKV